MERRRNVASPLLRCHQCAMLFDSIQQLSMHKEKFCIGSFRTSDYTYSYDHEREERLNNRKISQLRDIQVGRTRRSLETERQARLSDDDERGWEFQVDSDIHDVVESPSPEILVPLQDVQDLLRDELMANKRLRKKLKQQADDLGDSIDRKIRYTQPWKDDIDSQQLSKLLNEIKISQQKLVEIQDDIKNQRSRGNSPGRPQVLETTKTNSPSFVFSGSSLVAEASALRQYYLQSGGSDPNIIGQLNQMLAEAESLHNTNHNLTKARRGAKREDDTAELILALELENQRLQRELLGSDRHHGEKVALQSLRDSKGKSNNFAPELGPGAEAIDHDTVIPPIKYPSRYDPIQGFTCFYDFLTGLDPTTKLCQIAICLYKDDRELGEPSVLPAIHVTPFSNEGSAGSIAVVGIQQAFPNCPPLNDLSLVLEIQTSDSTVEHMSTKGWVKIDLFHSPQTLKSGAWKVPLKLPPIRPNISLQQMERLPQFNSSAAYIRIVNHWDADTQAEVEISPQALREYNVHKTRV